MRVDTGVSVCFAPTVATEDVFVGGDGVEAAVTFEAIEAGVAVVVVVAAAAAAAAAAPPLLLGTLCAPPFIPSRAPSPVRLLAAAAATAAEVAEEAEVAALDEAEAGVAAEDDGERSIDEDVGAAITLGAADVEAEDNTEGVDTERCLTNEAGLP